MTSGPASALRRHALRVALVGLVAYLCAVAVSIAAATLLVSGGIPVPVLLAVD